MSETPEPDAARPRGRRPNTEAETARVRERILEAFTEVFAEVGYHGLTVALVLEQAGISRHTYYRYFKDLDEPMDLVLQRSTAELVELVTPALSAEAPVAGRMRDAVEGYLEWGRRNRLLLPSFYAGLHDPSSPICLNRSEWVGILVSFLEQQFRHEDQPIPEPGRIHALLNSIEFSCYHHYLTQDPDDEAALAVTRETMLRVVVSLMTPPEQWIRTVEAVMARPRSASPARNGGRSGPPPAG